MSKILLVFFFVGISYMHLSSAAPFPLSNYQNPTPNSQLSTEFNLSGITYNWIAEQYVTVHQNKYCRFDVSFNQLFCGSLACGDCEDISFLGQNGDFYEYAIVEEGGPEGSVIIVQSPITTHVLRFDQVQTQLLTYAPTAGGDSGEGIAYDASTEVFYVCIEDPNMQVLSFIRPQHNNDVAYSDGSLLVNEVIASSQLTAILGAGADLSSCTFNEETGRLLLLSDIAHKLIDVDLSGQLFDQLELPDGQVEGFTFNDDFTQMVVVREPRDYQLYFAVGALFSDGFE